jgi:hypothetical protein
MVGGAFGGWDICSWYLRCVQYCTEWIEIVIQPPTVVELLQSIAGQAVDLQFDELFLANLTVEQYNDIRDADNLLSDLT